MFRSILLWWEEHATGLLFIAWTIWICGVAIMIYADLPKPKPDINITPQEVTCLCVTEHKELEELRGVIEHMRKNKIDKISKEEADMILNPGAS